ncbi:hypothetical protein BC829DRAFT_384266 [Chytridium lagenaria]|nr:hypothetical protein BC829DRAFT_384266 [Chytridium lagenaria]
MMSNPRDYAAFPHATLNSIQHPLITTTQSLKRRRSSDFSDEEPVLSSRVSSNDEPQDLRGEESSGRRNIAFVQERFKRIRVNGMTDTSVPNVFLMGMPTMHQVPPQLPHHQQAEYEHQAAMANYNHVNIQLGMLHAHRAQSRGNLMEQPSLAFEDKVDIEMEEQAVDQRYSNMNRYLHCLAKERGRAEPGS